MIAHIVGIVAEKFAGAVIVDVSGVGYEINIAANDYDTVTLNDSVKFYTYHHIREQSQELFGFSTLAAKKLFEMLITVQGVGPKAALAILSLDQAEHVRNAIANADSVYFAIIGLCAIDKRFHQRDGARRNRGRDRRRQH